MSANKRNRTKRKTKNQVLPSQPESPLDNGDHSSRCSSIVTVLVNPFFAVVVQCCTSNVDIELLNLMDCRSPDFFAVTKAAVSAKNILQTLPSAKRAAGKWKHYVTKKRRVGQ